jgi:hypothetical protein
MLLYERQEGPDRGFVARRSSETLHQINLGSEVENLLDHRATDCGDATLPARVAW